VLLSVRVAAVCDFRPRNKVTFGTIFILGAIVCAIFTALATAGRNGGSCSAALQVVTYIYSTTDIFIISVMQNRCLVDYDNRLLFVPLSLLLTWDVGVSLMFRVVALLIEVWYSFVFAHGNYWLETLYVKSSSKCFVSLISLR
jgi:hypothetical protein